MTSTSLELGASIGANNDDVYFRAIGGKGHFFGGFGLDGLTIQRKIFSSEQLNTDVGTDIFLGFQWTHSSLLFRHSLGIGAIGSDSVVFTDSTYFSNQIITRPYNHSDIVNECIFAPQSSRLAFSLTSITRVGSYNNSVLVNQHFMSGLVLYLMRPDFVYGFPKTQTSLFELHIGLSLPYLSHIGMAFIPHKHIFVETRAQSLFWAGYGCVVGGWQSILKEGTVCAGVGSVAAYTANPHTGSSYSGWCGSLFYTGPFNKFKGRMAWRAGVDLIALKNETEPEEKPTLTVIPVVIGAIAFRLW